MKFEVDKELFPFENHFLKTDAGAEVHYVDEGQGVVVLMLHGNPTWFVPLLLVTHFMIFGRLLKPRANPEKPASI